MLSRPSVVLFKAVACSTGSSATQCLFHDWLVRSLNHLEYGDDVSPMPVILNPPHSRRLGPIRAVCHACEASDEFLDDDNDTFPVKIVLTDMKRQRWKKKTGRIGTRQASTRRLSM